MSVEKKPTAKVKANFRTKAAEEAAGTAAVQKEEASANNPAGKASITKTTAAQRTADTAEKTVQKEVNEMAVKKTETAETAAEVKTPAKKAATAKKTTTARKTTAKKTAVRQPEVEVTLQWNGNEYSTARLLQSAKDVWQFDLGKNTDDFKTAQIYVKPEEGKAYVVVNGAESLSFNI